MQAAAGDDRKRHKEQRVRELRPVREEEPNRVDRGGVDERHQRGAVREDHGERAAGGVRVSSIEHIYFDYPYMVFLVINTDYNKIDEGHGLF